MRVSPLFVCNELISLIICKLHEKKSKIDILEELFFGMLIISIAWVTNKGLILIVWRLGRARLDRMISSSYKSRPFCSNAVTLLSGLFAEMIGALSVSADVHILLNIFDVCLIKRFIYLFHEEDFFPI
jgi:hypothetical protein